MNVFILSLLESDLIECLLPAFANVSNVYDSRGILIEETCEKQISTCGAEFSGSPHHDAELGRGSGPGS